MSNKEGEEFYANLPRKQLQSLCKKYGLPARKSSSVMAESLHSYFQFQQAFGGSIGNFQLASQSPFVSQCAGSSTNCTESIIGFNGKGPLQYRCKDIDVRACPAEDAAPSMGTKVPASFEFYVGSEEGIKLCVDLNSSPSDWIKKYKNQYSFENFSHTRAHSLQKELGRIGESNKQMKNSFLPVMDPGEIEDGHVQAKPSPSSVEIKNIHVEIDSQDGCDEVLMASPVAPCGVTVDAPTCIQEDQQLISSNINSDMQNKILTNAKSFAKNGNPVTRGSDITDPPKEKAGCSFAVNSISDGCVDLTPRGVAVDVSECIQQDQGLTSSNINFNLQRKIGSNTKCFTDNGNSVVLNSDITDPPAENSACNFVVNSTSDGCVDLLELPHKHLKSKEKICANMMLHDGCSLENDNGLVLGCAESRSMEVQLLQATDYQTDVPFSPDKNVKFLSLVDSKHNKGKQDALPNCSENDLCGNHLTASCEHQEWKNIINGGENSVCSEVDNSLTNICSKSGTMESNEEFHKKRQYINNECQTGNDRHDAKILRSVKHSTGNFVPRRSTRLVSK